MHLRVKSNWDLKPAHDVVARLTGAVAPEEWIVRGNHHDAWVNGADDPITGLAAMLEEARAFGELLKQGWKPRRTLIYCAWDAEEPALLGSTEWAEAHAEELRRHAVAYINTDSSGRGFLRAEGSHTLEQFFNEVARDVQDPDTRMSVFERARLARLASASTADRQEMRRQPGLRLGALGSGSDYTAFSAHLGVPSLNLAFGGLDGSGIYHSIYDDFYWYTHFADSDFRYLRALAQTAGTAVMRLAGAELLPFEFTRFAATVSRYASELERLHKERRAETEERNRQIEEGVFVALADARKQSVPPAVEPVPPQLDFAPLTGAAEVLKRAAERYEKALAAASPGAVGAVNQRLIQAERQLTDPDGLPGRPWFKHLVYAPGLYTGYSAKTLPLVREALEGKQWKEAEAGMNRTGAILEKMAAWIEAAAAELEKGAR